eukprot:scaffold77157_cov30-Phaeocystis_antarctica.AAC.1
MPRRAPRSAARYRRRRRHRRRRAALRAWPMCATPPPPESRGEGCESEWGLVQGQSPRKGQGQGPGEGGCQRVRLRGRLRVRTGVRLEAGQSKSRDSGIGPRRCHLAASPEAQRCYKLPPRVRRRRRARRPAVPRCCSEHVPPARQRGVGALALRHRRRRPAPPRVEGTRRTAAPPVSDGMRHLTLARHGEPQRAQRAARLMQPVRLRCPPRLVRGIRHGAPPVQRAQQPTAAPVREHARQRLLDGHGRRSARAPRHPGAHSRLAAPQPHRMAH